MADAFDPTDPRRLTEAQHLEELACLLAKGVHRALALRPPSLVPDSGGNRLDVLPQQNVHAPNRLTDREGIEPWTYPASSGRSTAC